MDREILFRGKSLLTGEWIESGSLRQWDNGCVGLVHPARRTEKVDSDTVGQYTGLKDRNGTRIFEGDVLEYYISYSGEVNRSVVVWGDGGWATQDSDFDEPVLIGEIGALAMTIAGNIHDNSELLEV